MRLILRQGEARDFESCSEVYSQSARLAFPWLSPEETGADRFPPSICDEELWVAEIEDAIAGLVSIHRPESFVHHLYVRPAMQRCGIGRALLGLALARCGGHAELKCQEANRKACLIYTLLGWRPVGWGWSATGPWIRFRY
jgi:GNAT superfamily N-acetyltransferase